MPILDQIRKIHDELGNVETLASYLKALRAVGVSTYASFVSDGHSEYVCLDGETLILEAVHETFIVADKADKEQFAATMDLTESGKLGYVEMSKRLADSGIERWMFDTKELTISYLDKAENIIRKESIQDTKELGN
jgi:uncharacterized protein YbcV (DUF1398 family)